MTEKERAAWNAQAQLVLAMDPSISAETRLAAAKIAYRAITALLDEPQHVTPEVSVRDIPPPSFAQSEHRNAVGVANVFPTQAGPTVDEDVRLLRKLFDEDARTPAERIQIRRIASRLEAATTKAPVSADELGQLADAARNLTPEQYQRLIDLVVWLRALEARE